MKHRKLKSRQELQDMVLAYFVVTVTLVILLAVLLGVNLQTVGTECELTNVLVNELP